MSSNEILIVGGNSDPRYQGGIESFSSYSEQALRSCGCRVEHVLAETAYAKLSSLGAITKALLRAWKATKSHRLVWLQYGNVMDLLFVALKLRRGVTLVVTPHIGVTWRSVRSRTLRRLSRAALGQVDRIAVVFASQEQELRTLLPPRVPLSEISTFLSPDLWTTPLDAGRGQSMHLVHASRLSEEKGTFRFLAICRALKERGIAFTAELIGTGSPAVEDRILSEIQAAGLENDISRVDRLPEPSLLARLARTDFLVHLSTQDSFPLTVLDAIGCGAFPICMPLSGVSILVERYAGFVVDAADPVGSAATCLETADLESIREQTRSAAEKLRRDLSWEASGRRVLATFELSRAAKQSRRAAR